MADISSIGGIGSSLSSSASTNIKMEDMLKVMLTELTYQDPLKPVENKDFMAQIAQFSALDSTRQLNDRIEKLLTVQSLSQTVGLLGKTVDASTPAGTVVTGQVTALSIVSGEPQMTVRTATGEVIVGITIAMLQNIR